MQINRHRIAAGIGSMAASGVLLTTLLGDADAAALRKPPMPCVAIQARVFPVGAGFCSETTGLDWQEITFRGELADQLANVECPGTPGTGDDVVPGSRHMPLC